MQNNKSNFIKLWLSDAAYAVASALSTGSVLTAFFLRGGISEGQIGGYLSVIQLVNFAISMLLAGVSSRSKDTRRPLFRITAVSGAVTALHALFCLFGTDTPVFFPTVLLIGCVIAILTALRTIYSYKLPCEVMDLRYYSVYAGYQGLFIGAAGISVGFLLPLFYEHYSFMTVTGCAFALSGIFHLLSATLVYRLVPCGTTDTPDETQLESRGGSVFAGVAALWKHKAFRALLLPNILRGFGAGLISMYSVFVISEGIFTEETVSLTTAALNIGTLLSCFIYVWAVRKIGIPMTGLLGCTVFVLLCFSVLGSPMVCLILYTAAYVGYNMVCCAIPDMIYRSVGSDIISLFQTWRLAMTQLGLTVSTALYSILIEQISVIWILVIGTAAFLLCGVGYYLYYKVYSKDAFLVS